MAGPYYVDLGLHYHDTVANTGAIGSPWGAVAGFMRSLGVVAAGEAINIKNSSTPTYADATKLWKFTVAAIVGSLTAGSYVICSDDIVGTPDAGGGQGYVAYASGTQVWIEVTAGTWASSGTHYLWKDGSNYAGTISAGLARAPTSITAGTATAPITIRGCANDANWTNDGVIVVAWDGGGQAGQPSNLMDLSGGPYYVIENLSFTRCGSHGIQFASFTIIRNVEVTLTGDRGIICFDAFAIIDRCISRLNTYYGIEVAYGTVRGSIAAFNGNLGIYVRGSSTVSDSAIYGNAGSGIIGSGGALFVVSIEGNVIDGNLGDGINITGDISSIIGNRITNNGDATEYGIRAATGLSVYEDYNVFYNNGSTGALHHTGTVSAPTTHSLTAASIAECGYTDSAYQFNYNNGDADKTFSVGGVITKEGGGWSATITAVTDSGATGTLTVSGFSGGMPATANGFIANGTAKHAHVNGTWTVTKAAGTGTPNYNLLLAAIGRRMSVSLDGTNNVILSAGLTPPPVPPSSAGNVLVAETAYESATGTSVAGTNVGCPTDKALYTGTPYYGAGGTENDGRVYECDQDKALKEGTAHWGVDGTQKDGNWLAPDGNAVLQYGYNHWGLNTAYDGAFVEPGVAHVQNGWTYGVSNSRVGTYAGGGGIIVVED